MLLQLVILSLKLLNPQLLVPVGVFDEEPGLAFKIDLHPQRMTVGLVVISVVLGHLDLTARLVRAIA